jgi:hypothetical protein
MNAFYFLFFPCPTLIKLPPRIPLLLYLIPRLSLGSCPIAISCLVILGVWLLPYNLTALLYHLQPEITVTTTDSKADCIGPFSSKFLFLLIKYTLASDTKASPDCSSSSLLTLRSCVGNGLFCASVAVNCSRLWSLAQDQSSTWRTRDYVSSVLSGPTRDLRFQQHWGAQMSLPR